MEAAVFLSFSKPAHRRHRPRRAEWIAPRGATLLVRLHRADYPCGGCQANAGDSSVRGQRMLGEPPGGAKVMHLVLSALAVVVLVSGAGSAVAYTDIVGSTFSCGSWTAERNRHSLLELQMTWWIYGFLSGVGFRGSQFGEDPLAGTDGPGVSGWFDLYCAAHPLDRIPQAAAQFVYQHPRHSD